MIVFVTKIDCHCDGDFNSYVLVIVIVTESGCFCDGNSDSDGQ